jgi:hypothetical protein
MVTVMAKPDPELVEEDRLLERAIRKKRNKFIWSGLLFVMIGLLIIAGGLFFNASPYSAAGILVGLGVVVVLIGVIRVLIGIINPISPDVLHRIPPPGKESS